MGRHGQFIMGPAGVGKSTYCNYIQTHASVVKRNVHVVNLDPAAEHFEYDVAIDIRDLISVDDAMEECKLGPNGGLVFCMEYLANNLSWLDEAIGEYGEDDYFLFDCPGQIELFSHVPVMKMVLNHIIEVNQIKICGVYLLDALFIDDAAKFLSGTMCALASMASLELPHVNVITKCDLVDAEKLEPFLLPQKNQLMEMLNASMAAKYANLNEAIASLIEEYNMVSFVAMDIESEDSVETVFSYCDHAIQYGEDLEPTEPKDLMEEERDE
eukprot:Stramenopile-MAST_4_protein_3953